MPGKLHLISGCHLCVGLTLQNANAEDLCHKNPGCLMSHKPQTGFYLEMTGPICIGCESLVHIIDIYQSGMISI